jgi:hypothetical protein
MIAGLWAQNFLKNIPLIFWIFKNLIENLQKNP